MKTVRYVLFVTACAALLSACSVFKPKYGCPAGGVGAEKVLSGEKQGKTKKFKA